MDLMHETVLGAAGADRAKVAEIAGRFTLELVSSRSQFEQGYALLNLQFGAIGELEREEVLSAWFERGSLSPPDAAIGATYHMVLSRDAAGTIAGVRDCYVTTDRAAGRVVVALSHSLVLPPFRRSGLAALLRSVAVPLGRRALQGAELLLAAEMEVVQPKDKDSVVRLMSYGRAGFWAIPPEVLPYAQPDFRDLQALGVEGTPFPFVPVVRQVGAEQNPTISRESAWAFQRHYHAVQGCHTDAAQIERIRAHTRTSFDAHRQDPISLVRLPRDARDVAQLEPLLASTALLHYPEAWRRIPTSDPQADLRALLLAWPGTAET